MGLLLVTTTATGRCPDYDAIAVMHEGEIVKRAPLILSQNLATDIRHNSWRAELEGEYV